MTSDQRKRWGDAAASSLMTVTVSVVAGLGLWYGIVERRLAIVEDRTARNEAAISRLADDHVTKEDVKRIDGKLDTMNHSLGFLLGALKVNVPTP